MEEQKKKIEEMLKKMEDRGKGENYGGPFIGEVEDENFKVFLIEANTNPCLEICSPLLARIIPELLDNSFRIAIDPLFQPS